MEAEQLNAKNAYRRRPGRETGTAESRYGADQQRARPDA